MVEILSWTEDTEKCVRADSFDHLILMLTERKAIIYVTKVLTHTISTYTCHDEMEDFWRMILMTILHDKFVYEFR